MRYHLGQAQSISTLPFLAIEHANKELQPGDRIEFCLRTDGFIPQKFVSIQIDADTQSLFELVATTQRPNSTGETKFHKSTESVSGESTIHSGIWVIDNIYKDALTYIGVVYVGRNDPRIGHRTGLQYAPTTCSINFQAF